MIKGHEQFSYEEPNFRKKAALFVKVFASSKRKPSVTKMGPTALPLSNVSIEMNHLEIEFLQSEQRLKVVPLRVQ
jgi:hypothetical protein